jgi:hypothetical protein
MILHKITIVLLWVWTLIHTILLLMFNGGAFSFCERSYFIPFTNTDAIFNSGRNWDREVFYLDLYDYSEFLFYIGSPWLIYIVFRYLRKK